MRYSNTVAILGAGTEDGLWMAKGICKSYRILLMDEELQKLTALSFIVAQHYKLALTENLLSSKEAGWEADIIVLAAPAEVQPAIARRISEVATCKTVILFSRNESQMANISAILPQAHLVEIMLTNTAEGNSLKAAISGTSASGIETAKLLLDCCHPAEITIQHLITV